MTDQELFYRLAIAALTGLTSKREDYPENIARDAVRIALTTQKLIKKSLEDANG